MKRRCRHRFIWIVCMQTETVPGELPRPKALWARELRSGKTVLIRGRCLRRMRRCPIQTDRNSLVVMYDAVPVLHGFYSLGWENPANLVDLEVEARMLTNGLVHPDDLSLPGMLERVGLPSASGNRLSEAYVDDMARLFDYLNQTDWELNRALYRASYLPVAAEIERIGIPIDVPLYTRLQEHLPAALGELIEEVDRDYRVYRNGRLDPMLFRRYLECENLPIPMDTDGRVMTDFDTLKSLSRSFPQLKPIKQMQWLLNKMQLHRLTIGADGCNRTLLRPYRSKTGRNQPSAAESIMGWSGFMRPLIRPGVGRALITVDFSAQDTGTAAALSGDPNLMEDYLSGDLYTSFAVRCSANIHGDGRYTAQEIRQRYKIAMLAIMYGMSAKSLARRLEIPLAYARRILEMHKRVYRIYWDWSESVVDFAAYYGRLTTRQGWTVNVTTEMTTEAIRNFLLQTHGSEMIRLACTLALERGLMVNLPVHDALLVETDIDTVDEAAQTCIDVVEDASEMILGNFRLRVNVDRICRYPEPYNPGTGEQFWQKILEKIDDQTQ